jgi:hypothetical protein
MAMQQTKFFKIWNHCSTTVKVYIPDTSYFKTMLPEK